MINPDIKSNQNLDGKSIETQLFYQGFNQQCITLPLSEVNKPKIEEFPIKGEIGYSNYRRKYTAPGMQRDDIFTPPYK